MCLYIDICVYTFLQDASKWPPCIYLTPIFFIDPSEVLLAEYQKNITILKSGGEAET